MSSALEPIDLPIIYPLAIRSDAITMAFVFLHCIKISSVSQHLASLISLARLTIECSAANMTSTLAKWGLREVSRSTSTKLLSAIAVVLWLMMAWPINVRAQTTSSLPHTRAQRIITISPNAAEIISTLGAADRIVGVSKFCMPLPALTDKPRIGGFIDPNLEKIVRLTPDLLIIRGHNDAVNQWCQQWNIKMYHDQTDSIAGIEKCIIDLGEILQLNKPAEKLLASFQNDLVAIKKTWVGKPKPRVFVTLSRHPDRFANLLTAGQDTFMDEMIRLAGGKNVFGQIEMAYPQVSPESILAKQPEVVIEFLPEIELTPQLHDQLLKQWQQLGPTPAVKTSRIHFITDDNALIPSPSIVDTIRKMARLIHPETEHD